MPDYIPDYTEQFDAYEARLERESRRYPKCDCCEEPILGDFLYDLGKEILCENCMKDNYRKSTDDYLDD